MKTLQIKIPTGFEVDNFNKETGEITFKEKPKCIMEVIKTTDDLLRYHKIEKDDFDADYKGLPDDVKNYRLIVLLAEALNEGWTPDWSNSSEYKYYPWFEMGSSGFRCNAFDDWNTTSIVGSRLCFKTAELAKYAGTQFTSLYNQFMLIK